MIEGNEASSEEYYETTAVDSSFPFKPSGYLERVWSTLSVLSHQVTLLKLQECNLIHLEF